jgi:hypothetical protein
MAAATRREFFFFTIVSNLSPSSIRSPWIFLEFLFILSSVMWFTHHLSEGARKAILDSATPIPLLPTERHQDIPRVHGGKQVFATYEERLACTACHQF